MTAPAPFPDPADKDAVRRWMRENRRSTVGRAVPATPEEFAAVQRSRLLEAAETDLPQGGRQRLEVALTGTPTDRHTVRVSTLGTFLSNLQESISAVAQALAGRPTSHASIPRYIREATALTAAATFPSSFGIAIFGPDPDEAADTALFPKPVGDQGNLLDDALGAMLDVVDLSESVGQSDDLLAERLVPLGPRSMKHLGALTAGLTDAGVGMRVTWHPHGREARRTQWSPVGVQRVRYLCEHSEFAEAEVIRVVGWLGGASAFRGKVEIRTDAGELIRASTDEDLTPHLHEYFNHRVEAEVEVTKVQAAGGRERKIYAVLRLRNL